MLGSVSCLSHVGFGESEKVVVIQSCLTLCDPMDCSPPGSSVGFSRQEFWSGWPFPSPGDLPDPRMIKPVSPALQADSYPSEPCEQWKAGVKSDWSACVPLSTVIGLGVGVYLGTGQ